jgi:Cdc6-like AAA superfamily ATPase
MESERQMLLSWGINSAFTPSAPIDDAQLFAGRTMQLRKVLNAVSQRGQHAIIFGERGVGKTSLANVLHDFLKKHMQQSFDITAVNCEEAITFSSLWHSVFRGLTIRSPNPQAGFSSERRTEAIPASDLLPKDVTPEDVSYSFKLLERPSIVIIDEIDRIPDKTTATRLADTIKTLSDHSVSTTVVLVGVGDSVDTLISEHASTERALVQIQMPRMPRAELFEIIDKGLNKVSMTIDQDAREKIAQLSEGLPHYTHLLSLHAAQEAIDKGRDNIQPDDVRRALDIALEHAQQSIVRGYHTATSSPRGNLYAQVLLACALAPVDELGYFSSGSVRDPMSKIMGRRYDIPAFSRHLNDFCESDRGPVLERTGYPRRYKFRFKNPLMEPYVLMNGIKRGLISENDVSGN